MKAYPQPSFFRGSAVPIKNPEKRLNSFFDALFFEIPVSVHAQVDTDLCPSGVLVLPILHIYLQADNLFVPPAAQAMENDFAGDKT